MPASDPLLSKEQIDEFRRTGHLTVLNVFSEEEIQSALADVDAWSEQFLSSLTAEQDQWYLERDVSTRSLRKLDNPVFHRKVFSDLARHPALVQMVHQLIGEGVSVFFSQVFMKPPGGGGPKPIHQDNFYFGPDDADATLAAWIALDDATVENGCLHYSNIHQAEIVDHTAPDDEPYNLQIPDQLSGQFQMTPAPVTRGGVSFHHGNTPHRSAANRSEKSRRATAFHYLRNDATLVTPTLAYDPKFSTPITKSRSTGGNQP